MKFEAKQGLRLAKLLPFPPPCSYTPYPSFHSPLSCSQFFTLIFREMSVGQSDNCIPPWFHAETPNDTESRPTYSKGVCVLWRELRQKQYDKFHRSLFLDIKICICLALRTHAQFIPTPPHELCLWFAEQMWLNQVSSSKHKSLLSACEGIVIADPGPSSFPANRIREAAQNISEQAPL